MRRDLFALSCLAVLGLVALVVPATSQTGATATGAGSTVIIAGEVISATDTDNDKKNDTFVIDTNGDKPGGEKTVVKKKETRDMGLIEVGDPVEIEVTVDSAGNLTIKDVIKIGK